MQRQGSVDILISGDLRRAELDDIPRIEAVIEAAFEQHLARTGFPPVQLLVDHTAAVEAGEIWMLGDPLVGIMSLIEVGDSLLIENMAVHPEAQGAGHGRRLAGYAEEVARQLGLKGLLLHSNGVMDEHRDFFIHLGFQEIDRRTQHGSRQVFMEKRLS